jgi:hypothetical protein
VADVGPEPHANLEDPRLSGLLVAGES